MKSMLQSDDSALQSADSRTNSNADPGKVGVWVQALRKHKLPFLRPLPLRSLLPSLTVFSVLRQEQVYIRSQMAGAAGEYWTDLSDTATPGRYTWSDGSVNVPYTNWARGMPGRATRSQIISVKSHFTHLLTPEVRSMKYCRLLAIPLSSAF